MRLIILFLFATPVFAQWGTSRFPEYLYIAGLDGPPKDGGIIYSQNGIVFSAYVKTGADAFGQTVKRCHPQDEQSDKAFYYYLNFKVSNTNADKKVVFHHVPAVGVTLKDVEENSGYSMCTNTISGERSVMGNIVEIYPGESIEFNDMGNGDWFFHTPRLTHIRLSYYSLIDVKNSQNVHSILGNARRTGATGRVRDNITDQAGRQQAEMPSDEVHNNPLDAILGTYIADWHQTIYGRRKMIFELGANFGVWTMIDERYSDDQKSVWRVNYILQDDGTLTLSCVDAQTFIRSKNASDWQIHPHIAQECWDITIPARFTANGIFIENGRIARNYIKQ